MSTRERIKPPERPRRHSEGENKHNGRREKITDRTARKTDPQKERNNSDSLEVKNGTSLRDARSKRRSDTSENIRREQKNREEKRQGGDSKEGRGGGRVERERTTRTDRFRNERIPSQLRDDRARRKMEERLEEGGRTSPVRGGGRERGRDGDIRGGGHAGNGEDEPSKCSSRLELAQMNPQEVPRRGYFYEHDNREAPQLSGRSYQTMTRKRRFVEHAPLPGHAPPWRDREDHTSGRERERESRFRRHSGDMPYHRRRVEDGGGGRERGEGDRRNREESRMERGNRWRGVRRMGEEERGSLREDRRRDGWREERQQRRSPARWRHDKFEVDEPATDLQEDKGEQRKSWDSGINKTWGHDKYEELITMETETTS